MARSASLFPSSISSSTSTSPTTPPLPPLPPSPPSSSPPSFSLPLPLSLLLLLLACSLVAADPPEVPTCPNVAGNVVINSGKGIGTTWDGWGTSLAWWANWAGGLNDQDFNLLMDLFFRLDSGLGLNIARYNIGGGGYSPHSHSQFKGFLKYRAMPGFKWNKRSPIDPSQDANQRKVLLAARDRGANQFEAFSNSPPAYMTITKSFTGSRHRYEDNLAPEKYRSFANYLVQVVTLYRQKWGVTFKTLEPINEAVEGHWLLGGLQEGCNMKSSSIASFIPIIHHSLRKSGAPTTLAFFDSSGRNTIPLIGESKNSR